MVMISVIGLLFVVVVGIVVVVVKMLEVVLEVGCFFFGKKLFGVEVGVIFF